MFSSNVPEDVTFELCVCVCVYTLAHFVPPDNINMLIQEEEKKRERHRGGWGIWGLCPSALDRETNN